MNTRGIIITAIIVTAILRIAPVFIMNSNLKKSKKFLDLLDYAACAAIGTMIYLSAFCHGKQCNLLNKGLTITLCNILILMLSFFLSIKIKNPVKVFIICMILYLAINMAIFL